MKSITIYGINRYLSKENRILNEINCLNTSFQLKFSGFRNDESSDIIYFYFISFIRIFFNLLGKNFLKVYFNLLKKDENNFLINLVICHHIDEALICIDKKVKFVFHSNEYLPREFDGNLKFKIFEQAYRRITLNYLLPKAELIVVECDRIANEYSNIFKIPLNKFFIATNAPKRNPTLKAKYPSSTIKLIHHGALVKERGPEFLFEILKKLGPGYTLTLMGPGKENYIKHLKKLADKIGNIEIIPPVPYEKIVETISQYDLGLIIFKSKHFHHKFMTVPNKFYECLQARVPVVVSPFSAMSPLIAQNQCGIVSKSESVDDYVNSIKSLTKEKIYEMGTNCNKLAFEHSNEFWFEAYRKKISSIINQ